MFNKDTGLDNPLVSLCSDLKDSISCLRWSPGEDSSTLAIGSWDEGAYIWKTDPSAVLVSAFILHTPVLQLAWNGDGTRLFAACGDSTVRCCDPVAGFVSVHSRHSQPVGQISFCPRQNLLYTMSWDRTIAAWDARQEAPVAKKTMEVKPHYMSVVYPTLAVARSDRKVSVMDLTLGNLTDNWMTFDSKLSYGVKSIAVFPRGPRGWAAGGFEGRCEVSTLLSNGQLDVANTYKFNAHRHGFAVNAVAFNPKRGTLITGGSDSRLVTWNKDVRQRILEYPDVHALSAIAKGQSGYVLSIHDCAYNANGDRLAVAVGYDWPNGDLGSVGRHRAEVLVHYCPTEEVRKRNGLFAGSSDF